MKARLAALAVGLAADCDKPESAVQEIMRKNLPDARTLPFVAFLTHDLKWAGGYSGGKDEAGFAAVLAEVEKSPLLAATEAVRKKLEPLAAKAAKAAGEEDYKTVVKCLQDAADLLGRCPERDALTEAETQAQAWAEAQIAEAVTLATGGTDDFAGARARLSAVKKHFGGEPEAADAEQGLKAVTILERWSRLAAVPPVTREKSAAEFAGTRWEAVLRGPTPGK